MECTLLTLIACLSWSNVYVDSGLGWLDAEVAYFDKRDFIYNNANGVVETGYSSYASRDSRNPYGRISVGTELSFSRSMSMRLELQHVSSVATSDDDGINSGWLSLRWYPFRK